MFRAIRSRGPGRPGSLRGGVSCRVDKGVGEADTARFADQRGYDKARLQESAHHRARHRGDGGGRRGRPSACASRARCSTSGCSTCRLFLPPFLVFAASSTGFSSSTARNGASPPCRISSTSSAPRRVLALALLVVDYVLVSPHLFGFFFFGKITIALYWLVQMFLLGGPRLAFRYMKYARSRNTLQREATRRRCCSGAPATWRSCCAPSNPARSRRSSRKASSRTAPDDLGQSIRGVPVLGAFADLDQVVQDFQERGDRHPAPRRRRRARSCRRPIPTCSSPGRAASACRCRGSRASAKACATRSSRRSRSRICSCARRSQIDRHRLERFIARQARSRHRRRRLDRLGNLRPRGRVRRLATSSIVESSEPSLHHILENPALLARATRGSMASSPTCATGSASARCCARSGRTSCSTPPPSSTCPISRRTGTRASRPTCSARSTSPTRRSRRAPPRW